MEDEMNAGIIFFYRWYWMAKCLEWNSRLNSRRLTRLMPGHYRIKGVDASFIKLRFGVLAWVMISTTLMCLLWSYILELEGVR